VTLALPISVTADGLILTVRVTPKSAKEKIEAVRIESDGRPVLTVRLSAPPVEGAANAALVAFLAKHWRIPKSAVKLLSGETARVKRLAIQADAALRLRITEEVGALAHD
jgi:uncharacterized protein (TIGR00251 family)